MHHTINNIYFCSFFKLLSKYMIFLEILFFFNKIYKKYIVCNRKTNANNLEN